MTEFEQPFAIDPVNRRARRLRKADHRDYEETTPEEFFGTADVIGKRNGRYFVRDYKTGATDLGDPCQKMQMRFFAAALYLLEGAEEVEVEFMYIDENGKVTKRSGLLDTLEHETTIETLGNLHRGLESARQRYAEGYIPTVFPGDHCQWCPAYTSCPAKMALARQLADPMAIENVADMLSTMTPAQIANAWVKYKDFETAFYKVGDALKEYAKTHTIELPGGKVVRPISQTRTSVDTDRLIKLAKRRGVTSEEIAACTKVTMFDVLRTTNNKKA